jgi:hypothetical protein
MAQNTWKNHFERAFIEPQDIDDNGRIVFECKLCAKCFAIELVDEHFNSPLHQMLVNVERNIQENPVALVYRLWQTRIASVGLPSWRNAIQAKIFDGSFNHSISLAKTDQLKEAKSLFTKYHRMEVISLVELAVWKAMCIASYRCTPGVHQGYHDWLQWTRHGWKSAKSETRLSNEIGIVICALLPFVE